MQKNKFNRKPKIEVYFILYLAALILLLPEDKDKDPYVDNSPTYSAYLQAEKTVLNCKLAIHNNRLEVVSLDSINNIVFFGDVYKVNYNVTLETTNKQGISKEIQSTAQNHFFSFRQNSKDLMFKWNPELIRQIPATYTVKVAANSIYKNNGILNEAILKTQFVINVVLDASSSPLNDLAVNDLLKSGVEIKNYNLDIPQNTLLPTSNQETKILSQNNNLSNTQNLNVTSNQETKDNYTTNFNYGNFDISAENNIVRSLAYNNWNNFIFFYNINPLKDLSSKPEISITLENNKENGSAKIAEITEKGILLEGKTPASSNMKVTFSIQRKQDKKQAIIDFIVKPSPITKPIFPPTIYPEVNYQIRPNLPLITSEQVHFYLKEADKLRYSSSEGEDFTFSAQQSDTGKVFIIERYIGKELLGEKYTIKVLNYPNPEIIEVNKVSDKVIQIKTKSYGVFLGEMNIINKVLTDDFQIQELVGKYRQENSNNLKIHFQTFNLTLKSASSDKKEFLLKISDKRNFLSNSKKFTFF